MIGEQQVVWRCFWFDGEDGVSSYEPEPATLEWIAGIMAKLLTESTRTFVGIVDERDVVMQFAGQLDGTVLMEIPVPALRGSWYANRSLVECLAVVVELERHNTITQVNYPDLRWRPWLAAQDPEAEDSMRHTNDTRNPFELLADVDWQEEPQLTLHAWRVELPSVRDESRLRAEFADYRVAVRGGSRSAIFSVVDKKGARGPEVVIKAADLRKLKALLDCTDMSPETEAPADDDQRGV